MNENKLTVSVIVPVFLVADYLDRCVESLVNQRYSNLEIILVDDGSPDNCAIMCDEWAKNDERITVIHKPNGGLSDARNAGMRIAAGRYIGFIDSDDYISADFFNTLLSVSINHNSDIVECSVVKVFESGKSEEYADDSVLSDYSAEDALSLLIREDIFHQHVWNKLYTAEVVRGIEFEVGKLNEDEFWTYQVFGRAKRVSKINKTMYYYFQRESSIMGQSYNLRRLDALEGICNRQRYIEKNYPELVLQGKLAFFGSCIYAYQCILKFLKGRERRIGMAVVTDYSRACGITINDISTIKGSSKKYFYLAKINIFLCCLIRNLIGAGF